MLDNICREALPDDCFGAVNVQPAQDSGCRAGYIRPEADLRRMGEPVLQISEHQAYVAMLAFLDAQYSSGVEELGALVGSLSLLADARPADPGIPQEWRAALEFALTSR
jgi:hypothetical protein